MTAIPGNAEAPALRQFCAPDDHSGGAPVSGWKSRIYTASFLIATKILLLVCLWSGLLVYLNYEKRAAFSEAGQKAASFARALEEHTLSTVRSIDQTTLFVKYQYEHLGGKVDLAAYARSGMFLGKFFNLIGISDADGWFFMSDRPLPRSNLSDREHFLTHVAVDTGRLFISKPVLGRSSGKWSVQFTRRINTSNGGFGGVVITSLDPAYFSRFYHSIDIGEHGTVLLAGTDGIVRARSNGKDSDLGQDLNGTPLFLALKTNDRGSIYVASALDGVRRLVSYRTLADYPLVVAVGIAEAEIFKGYIERRNVLLALGGLISLLIVATGLLFAKRMEYQNEVEEALRHGEQAALSANKSKSEFLANMSHELRTPMHAILSFAELGVRRSGEPDKIAGYLTRIQQSGKRLLSLLNDLLDLSKLEAGRMRFEPEMSPIRPVIDRAVDELSALLKHRHLKVRISGNSACERAYFDLSKIAQVLHNLLGNASKFAPENSVIDVSYAADAPGELAISVRDNGPGIPPDEIDAIFDQFVQSSKTKTGAGGTGLGLAICRQIVQAHGGRIWACNNPGGGASFVFTLQLAPPQPEIRA